MWKKYCRAGHATDDNMAQAHCMLDISEYTILIAFPQQQWLHERTLRLRYTYIHWFSFHILLHVERRIKITQQGTL